MTNGFGSHLYKSQVFDLLATHWRRSRDYVSFLDDVLIMADEGKLPDYIAPMVLRATHVEVCNSRCQQLDHDYEEQMDMIAEQCTAVFARFLAREHQTKGQSK